MCSPNSAITRKVLWVLSFDGPLIAMVLFGLSGGVVVKALFFAFQQKAKHEVWVREQQFLFLASPPPHKSNFED